jgi:type I restriction enzyme, S subunit
MAVMRARKGAEVGSLPADWDVVPLGELVCITSGESPSRFRFLSSGTPYFKVEQLSASNKYLDNRSTPYHFGGDRTVPARSIVFAKRGAAIALNKIRILSEASFMDTNLMALTPGDRLDFEYLYYALGHIGLWRFADTTSVPQINNKHINPLPFPLPDLPEQRSIAKALSNVDRLIDGLDELLGKKRDLRQAVMQQLLSGRVRLPGFDGRWDEQRLGQLGIFLKGRGVKKDESLSGSLPCVRYGELYTRHENVVREFHSAISPAVASTARRLLRGDLLFANSGETKEEIGKCAAFTADREAYAGGDIVILRDHGQDPTFMGYYCNFPSVAAQKASKGQGDAVVHISARALADVVLRLPSVPEQQAIAGVLEDIDAEIGALETRREKTRDLKQAMMQELITGRTRLVIKGGANV